MIIKIQINSTNTKIKITSKPKDELGNLDVVQPASQDIIDALAGRSKAYFYAVVVKAGEPKIYGEAKNIEEW